MKTFSYYMFPKCQGPVNAVLGRYTSTKKNPTTGALIVIPDVQVLHCQNRFCGHSYFTRTEENRIDQLIDKSSSQPEG